jgi:hypothetical protein
MYGVAVSLQIPIDNLYAERPYIDGTTWKDGQWEGKDGVLNPLSRVEDQNDIMSYTDGVLPGDSPNQTWDGDQRTLKPTGPNEWIYDLTPFDLDNDGSIELPAISNPDAVGSATEYNKQQALLFVITHEVGHALGGPSHSDVSTCLMNRYAESWQTVDKLSDFYKSLLRVHNIAR